MFAGDCFEVEAISPHAIELRDRGGDVGMTGVVIIILTLAAGVTMLVTGIKKTKPKQ